MSVLTAPSGTLGWIERNLAVAGREFRVIVHGAHVAYRTWGPRDADGILFVHGGLAHGGWWDHIGPALSDRRTVAIDLSGNGDSAHRGEYSIDEWADEVAAVARAAGLRNAVLVGHSMGGVVSVAAAHRHPGLFRAVVTLDTRFNDAGWPGRDKVSPVFADVEQGIERFSFAHDATEAPIPEVLRRHIARTSLRRDDDGAWRWKRTDRLSIRNTRLRDLLPHLPIPLAIIRTEGGVLDSTAATEMRSLTPTSSVDVVVPASGHNAMLDQPVAFVSVLRTLLTAWLPSVTTTARPHPSRRVRENE
jgi:pimeloyl-ACP methyl ester carboxylesterase